MRLIICGCEKKRMEYLLEAMGLIARRDRTHLTVSAPDDIERNDDMCRYVTLGEDIHTDIGRGMADALVVYRCSAGIRRIEHLKNSGKLIFVRDAGSPAGHAVFRTDSHGNVSAEPDVDDGSGLFARSPSARREAAYLKDLLYLKKDAVVIEKSRAIDELFEFYAEEEILRLLGLR